MNKLSVTIITKNEENNIARCIESVKWADEILVVDSYSEDKTAAIAESFNAKVILTDWKGFGATKRFAVDAASNDWILSIDADEVVSEALKEKIISILKQPSADGYHIKRKSFYLGRQIVHCGWNSDYPLRLFDRRKGNFNNKNVHESVELHGNRKKLEETILHYTYPTVASHISKMNRYSDLSAQNLIEAGKIYSPLTAVLLGLNKFLKMYVLKLGLLDGAVGFLLCLNSAYGVYLKYVKTWKSRA
ncbi:MAG: glycosyltransferase family 2 protein [Melioribacteraceae bacterium]|nr:glycosyltransferase family 2 protein [Melioribacteraceae bacterium]